MKRQSVCAILLAVFSMMLAEVVQAQSKQSGDNNQGVSGELNFHGTKRKPGTSRGFRLMPPEAYANVTQSRVNPAAVANPVIGSGSAGRLTKWTGLSGANTYSVGDSGITEDKFGKIGIGTITPTSPLTVTGMIETINPGGGIKFPDGTIQTTSATGALFSIPHDATLTGNGTAASPLGVAVPLILTGTPSAPMISVTNSSPGRAGLESFGGNAIGSPGGRGVQAFGGSGTTGGGDGLFSVGGSSGGVTGGPGVSARGGQSITSGGGVGISAVGGDSISGGGGTGVAAFGGTSDSGAGGDALFAARGSGPMGIGLAGDFFGDVQVSGMLSKGGGSFKIDHPLDPENRYLYHSFVESPDMKNIYDGVATLDSNGEAVIELPEWFQVLNRDFRYLLTPIGAPMPGLFIGQKVKENRFKVAGGAPGMEVSWQVTGIRQDAWANQNRIKVEVEKSERERGHYLHPEAFDQPEERGIEYSRHPEMMKQRTEGREQVRPKQQ